MALISHSKYLANVSLPNLLRGIVSFLTVDNAKPGRMWSTLWLKDDAPAAEFHNGSMVAIMEKVVASTGAKLYVKLVLIDKTLTILSGSRYSPATDNNTALTLGGSWRDDSCRLFDALGAVVPSTVAPAPAVILDAEFNRATDRIAKVWMVRQLDPLLDSGASDSSISFWCSFCTEESDEDPIEKRGFYSHLGFGVAGEAFVPDTDQTYLPGAYAIAGSYSSSAVTGREMATRLFAGSGRGAGDNIGGVVCAGRVDGVQTWFLPLTTYGYCRDPFDESIFDTTPQVGFDFTELCTFSPYSSVRVLTPAYVFGCYEDMHRILCRVPIYYTDLTGLYSGDTITQDVDGVVRSYMLFPFWRYRCLGEPGAKRGYAIFVPADETV